MHYLITTGGTREHIDPVRYISNASTGRLGYALTEAALSAGHTVTLIIASVALNPPLKANAIQVVSAQDMLEAVRKSFIACDCLIMAAAVSDYTPLTPVTTKIKKDNGTLTLELKPTTDILAWAGRHKDMAKQRIVGFALEDRNLYENAEKKLKEKNLDMIIANYTKAIGATHSEFYVKTPHADWITLPHKHKSDQAHDIIRLTEKLFERTS